MRPFPIHPPKLSGSVPLFPGFALEKSVSLRRFVSVSFPRSHEELVGGVDDSSDWASVSITVRRISDFSLSRILLENQSGTSFLRDAENSGTVSSHTTVEGRLGSRRARIDSARDRFVRVRTRSVIVLYSRSLSTLGDPVVARIVGTHLVSEGVGRIPKPSLAGSRLADGSVSRSTTRVTIYICHGGGTINIVENIDCGWFPSRICWPRAVPQRRGARWFASCPLRSHRRGPRHGLRFRRVVL